MFSVAQVFTANQTHLILHWKNCALQMRMNTSQCLRVPVRRYQRRCAWSS